MEKQVFFNGMTVKELKEAIKDWPEEDENGEPCEVWIGSWNGCSNQVRSLYPLNKRESEDGSKKWADVILEPNPNA